MSDVPLHERERLHRSVTGGRGWMGVPGAAEARAIEALIARRLAGEPLQYLEGTVDFGPLELAVDPRALIPRPETEQLWELAVETIGEAGAGPTIVDLGTGTGALALALKHTFPASRVFAVDISSAALSLAAENVRRTGLEVTLLQGDLFSPLPGQLAGKIDLLVSNPPYVAEHEWPRLPADVRDHEPREALVAGPVGTEVLARIAREASDWLAAGGFVICEIGETQGDEVRRLFAGFDAEIRLDLAARDRFVVARKDPR